MFVILTSLLTAACFGTGDFLGGLAAKRTAVIQVVAGSHLVGLAGVTVAAVLFAESVRAIDVGIGALGGAFGGFGVALLYRRLAVGPMHVVAPLTAITSAVIPTAWGLVIGERLTLIVWVGIGLGVVAIGLVSSADTANEPEMPAQPVNRAVVGESLLAGCGFGGFFILLDATDITSAPWPIVGARLCTSLALVAALLILRRPIVPQRLVDGWLIAATGIFDTIANIGFLLATLNGQLAVVAVLTSLYPIATAMLARIVLGERMNRLQGMGFVGALGATTLIAAG